MDGPAPKAEPRQDAYSACPHDCPSTCAVDVEFAEDGRITRLRGAKDNSYTDGVICAKVARYSERLYHPDRLTFPLKRTGPKGSKDFTRISWDEALNIVADRFLADERKHGAESVWPYYFAGTMGLVMRDGIHRLRHAKRYSGEHDTICTTLAWTGWNAGTGKLAGADPREMADADVVVIWGTNPVNTQVNVMTHAVKARKNRGAKIVAVDVYENATVKQADLGLVLKPGSDAALALAVMHVLFRDSLADRDYMNRYTDDAAGFEQHLRDYSPQWAAPVTGLSVEAIEEFAHLVGRNKRTFFRLGYGFTRHRNGAEAMHTVLCVPAVTGAWAHRGGGAFHSNGAIFKWNRTLINGLDCLDPSVRVLDQSRIGPVLTGDKRDLGDGPPVTSLLIQNTNPMLVAPDLGLVAQGFARDDLFACVHEQFMTETARMADIVLPATMFLEHDDLYQGGGHQHILLGPKVVEPAGECRSNHEVICGLAKRVGAEHEGFDMSVREIIDWTLKNSGWRGLADLEAEKWFDVQPPFEDAHYINGFGHADGKFHLKPDWTNTRLNKFGPDDGRTMKGAFPTFFETREKATVEMPFRLVTAPARNFLNSSFTETPTSLKQERRPTLLMRSDDLERTGIADGDLVLMGNDRGQVSIHVKTFEGLTPGTVVSESIWPNEAFVGGKGINHLTGADPAGPVGGAAFHDNAVWIRPSE
ncbi:MAG: molybdopterin oxidoreductase family protein [Alphaproteobacteria bacterium]